MKTRKEHDPLGKKDVPLNAYYGAHTQRALENFQISTIPMDIEQFHAIATIKIAAARANSKLKLLQSKKAKAIEKAALELLSGDFDEHLVIDVYQAGAGTPTHMNVNEVLANRANELLKGKKGEYKHVHPNDHVNMGQSTNDVFATGMRLALLPLVKELDMTLKQLHKSFQKKASQFRSVLKSGRTHLQDAVPILFGQEIGAWATTIDRSRSTIAHATKRLQELHIGGSAIGTGINTHKQYRDFVIQELRRVTRLQLRAMSDTFYGTQSLSDFVCLSSALRECAVELTRIANDIRLLSSGPRTGVNELFLPEVEPGSSIMPGKVNPSIAEMLNMVCFQVMGNDRVIELAAQAGQLELNVMMPIVAHNLIQSVKILTNALNSFDYRCVQGIKVNKKACKYYFDYGLGLATFLNPVIGYDKAAKVAQRALKEHKTIKQVILEQKIMSEKELEKLFHSKSLTGPNL